MSNLFSGTLVKVIKVDVDKARKINLIIFQTIPFGFSATCYPKSAELSLNKKLLKSAGEAARSLFPLVGQWHYHCQEVTDAQE